jgi:hypothetical protein
MVGWHTGTSINPMLRAAHLAADHHQHAVVLVVPWVTPEQQSLLYPAGLSFSSHEQQAEYILKGEHCVHVAVAQAAISNCSDSMVTGSQMCRSCSSVAFQQCQRHSQEAACQMDAAVLHHHMSTRRPSQGANSHCICTELLR